MPKGVSKTPKETSWKRSEAQRGEKNHRFGKHHSEEEKQNLSESLKGEKSPHFGNRFSAEHRKKISETRKRLFIEKKLIPPNLGKTFSEELKNKLRKNHADFKGEKHPRWKGGEIRINCKICGKEKTFPVSTIKKGQGKFCSQKCFSIWNIKHMKKKDTSIELAVENELKRRGIPYLKQVPIKGIALVDFLLPNKIIIQADGDYWHSRKKNKGKDISQDTELYFKNYKVFRFTETEINKSAKKCINKVMNIGN